MGGGGGGGARGMERIKGRKMECNYHPLPRQQGTFVQLAWKQCTSRG